MRIRRGDGPVSRRFADTLEVAPAGFGLMNLMNAKSSLAINEIMPMLSALGIGMVRSSHRLLLKLTLKLIVAARLHSLFSRRSSCSRQRCR